ncbi:type II toxin-antitoxin system HicA family toxin [Salmonella enterica subsp. enterica serovar Mountpleasant]|nr:type II toxin-antitoxin system HicA family toxin [Salmonella enterica subsp. enterica serovar Mountpleasant]ECM3181885.1 type II toxin-antitoxin system HicA family toxin [Salmonella enterica subsp. enterica serovar Newport]EEG6607549.1 type II toxin-antitoxin system HicA family toxin [Salmonella enterica]EHL2774441.1 type II toxin-antitoxin system HicA family toxin [Salmonella enterica subsp. enterica serovar Hvittingfoss]ECO0851947.1 type II toxin-antitoxin system HicA family toxin [Salmone
MKSSELIKLLESKGWILERINGSHHHFTHPDFPVILSVPHPRKDIKPGTLNQILKKAKLK